MVLWEKKMSKREQMEEGYNSSRGRKKKDSERRRWEGYRGKKVVE